MSAFIVSNAHISAITGYANREMASYRMPPIEDMATILHDANVVSVNYRYPEHQQHPKFRFHYPSVRHPWSAIEIVKACHCLAYQSCEPPTWEASEAKKLLDRIESFAVSCIPGYNEAPWDIAGPPKVEKSA